MENEGEGRGRYDASTCFMVRYKMSAKNTGSKYISCSNTCEISGVCRRSKFVKCAAFHLFGVFAYTDTDRHTHTHTHTSIFSV